MPWHMMCESFCYGQKRNLIFSCYWLGCICMLWFGLVINGSDCHLSLSLPSEGEHSKCVGLNTVYFSVTLRSFCVLSNRYSYKRNIIVCYEPRPLVSGILSLPNFKLNFFWVQGKHFYSNNPKVIVYLYTEITDANSTLFRWPTCVIDS
jgi:hypothetical protein